MAEALLPPAPVLNMLSSNHAILLIVNHDIALTILQGMLSTRAHIPPTRKWADLERLLFEPDPPAQDPFHGLFKHWADSQRYEKRGTKDTMQGNRAAGNTTRRGGQRTQHKVIRQWWWYEGVTRRGKNATIKLRL
jgi:hypothetical protein